MTSRQLAGNFISWSYNFFVGRIPVPIVRKVFLKTYLKTLGSGSFVGTGCRFLNGRKISLGARNHLNHGCLLDGRCYEIRTGDDVSIGPEATILTLGHDPQSADFKDRGGDVVIGDRVWIAYRAIILPGMTLGEGAVVGAGAVVSKDVEPFTIVAGNPARPVGQRNPDLTYKL